MVSFLEGSLAKAIARGFKGKLKVGTIRENQPSGLDDFGDEVPPDTIVEHTFTGIRENFDASWMARALIPETDVSILILLQSVNPLYQPKQDDLVFIEKMWHKIRRILKIDPAGASIQLQCYVVQTPDTP